MIHVVEEDYTKNPMKFEKLLEDAEKPLYLGCSKFTKLPVLVRLYNLKARNGWSNKSFYRIIKLTW